jgi:hypothetical protein
VIRQRFVLLFVIAFSSVHALAQGGELRFCIHAEPKTFNPLLVADDSSETIRGVGAHESPDAEARA